MKHWLVNEGKMDNTREKSVWNELWNAIKYCKESKRGKYSLDTYLDIIGEYTDRQILNAEQEGLKYLGGECRIHNSFENEEFDFEIKMFFENDGGNSLVKESKWSLPKERFTSETEQGIEKDIRFEIQKPE